MDHKKEEIHLWTKAHHYNQWTHSVSYVGMLVNEESKDHVEWCYYDQHKKNYGSYFSAPIKFLSAPMDRF